MSREPGDRAHHAGEDAFAYLASRWNGRVFALAYRLTQDEHAAEDVCQTALLRAYERLGEFNGRASFSTWLYRIVVNVCRDVFRTTKVRSRASLRLHRERDDGVTVMPCEPSERHETAQRVMRAVRSLPAGIREVVVLRHYMDLRFTEVAEILEIPASTAKSRMGRGLELLRESLAERHS